MNKYALKCKYERFSPHISMGQNVNIFGLRAMIFGPKDMLTGRISTEIYTGYESNEKNPENGFMAQNTPFGWTCPGWDFSRGLSPAAIPWIFQNLFDYYLFTGDESMLRDRICPMMKETATLFDQIMVYSKKYDKFVSSPTYSPEQGPRTE